MPVFSESFTMRFEHATPARRRMDEFDTAMLI
jgi:hypothetical protein